MSAQTIDSVIERLEDIIAWSYDCGSRIGFFPALYRKTTIEIKRGLGIGRFEDPERMEVLDIAFAGRYFEAFERHRQNEQPTRAWAYAFRMADHHAPSVMQHLLLGMNAHINLDLGISVADVAPAEALPGLKHDFNEINAVLGELIDRVQEDLASVFPAIHQLDDIGGALDEQMVRFSIKKARAAAWHKAELLAGLPAGADWTSHIRDFDRETTLFAQTLCLMRRRPLPAPAGDRERVRRMIEALMD
jgi:hypothetical protein